MISYISPTDSPHFKTKKRTITILGSTGSIGTSSLNVIRHNRDDFQVVGLAGARNIELLAEQANEFRPGVLGVYNEALAGELSSRLDSGYCPDIVYGTSGYENMAMMDDADFIMSAMVGAAGLRPTMAAAQKGKVILLANKESLVLAGDLISETCNKYQSVILPVDSEHNALFQAMQGHEFKDVESIIITASGGPFRGRDKAFMSKVTPEQALDHPNWSMGAKISIDSATMMNKGLEVIEACHLFGISTDKIKVLVHPESIVHSLVGYIDGSLLAHMGTPDMMIPIAHCLGFPGRLHTGLEPLDLTALERLTFFAPDYQAFPCLKLALKAFESGPDYPVVLNAANEICVEGFLNNKIGFMDIALLNAKALDEHVSSRVNSLEQIMELDLKTRSMVRQWIEA